MDPNKPPFLRKILKIHIAYTLSQTKSVLHIELHGNRFSRSPVMPAQTDTQTHRHTDTQTDRQTKKNFKNLIFVLSALNYTCWYDLFLKNRKLQEIFGLQIYIYKDKDFTQLYVAVQRGIAFDFPAGIWAISGCHRQPPCCGRHLGERHCISTVRPSRILTSSLRVLLHFFYIENIV